MGKGYLLTIDINKAFDTIDRDALFDILDIILFWLDKIK